MLIVDCERRYANGGGYSTQIVTLEIPFGRSYERSQKDAENIARNLRHDLTFSFHRITYRLGARSSIVTEIHYEDGEWPYPYHAGKITIEEVKDILPIISGLQVYEKG
jgi:hypothetical protein